MRRDRPTFSTAVASVSMHSSLSTPVPAAPLTSSARDSTKKMWILDSGAANHLAYDQSQFAQLEPYTILMRLVLSLVTGRDIPSLT